MKQLGSRLSDKYQRMYVPVEELARYVEDWLREHGTLGAEFLAEELGIGTAHVQAIANRTFKRVPFYELADPLMTLIDRPDVMQTVTIVNHVGRLLDLSEGHV